MTETGGSHETDLKRWSAHLLLRRAIPRAQRHQWAEADRLVARSINLAPDLAEAHFMRGKICFWQGDFHSAESAFLEARRLGMRHDRCDACIIALADEQSRRHARDLYRQELRSAGARLSSQYRAMVSYIVRDCTVFRRAQLAFAVFVIVLLWLRLQP